MNKIFFFSLISTVISCNSQQPKVIDSLNITNQVTISRSLFQHKSELDSAIAKSKLNLVCYYLEEGKFQQDSCAKKDYSAAWRIWKNTDLIVAAKHEYSSESNDIFVQEMSYFDSIGDLFCKDQFVSFINSICTDRGMIHHRTYFYDRGEVIDSSVSLYDSDNIKYGIDSCLVPYTIKNSEPVNTSQLMQNLHLK